MDSNDQPQERVLIEDYHGPASHLPPSAPTNAQITADTKHEPGAVSNTTLTSLAIDWTLDLATLGVVISAAAAIGLLPTVFVSLAFKFPSYNIPIDSIKATSYGEFIAAIAIIGFLICTVADFRYRTSLRPAAALLRSRIGLVLSALAFIVVLFG